MIRPLRAIDPRNAIGLVGLASIVAGAWEIYRPAALIFLGLALVAFAIFAPREQ